MASRAQATIDNSRALVPPAEDLAETDGDRLHRPLAAFLTQLLATKNGLPQTRLRRRIEASDATAVYEAQAPEHVKPPQHRLWRQL